MSEEVGAVGRFDIFLDSARNKHDTSRLVLCFNLYKTFLKLSLFRNVW